MKNAESSRLKAMELEARREKREERESNRIYPELLLTFFHDWYILVYINIKRD